MAKEGTSDGFDHWVLHTKSVASAPPLPVEDQKKIHTAPVPPPETFFLQAIGDNYLFQKKDRKEFITKVYSIILIQSALILATELCSVLFSDVKSLIADYNWTLLICFICITSIVYISLSLVRSMRQSYPLNLVLLMIMTVGFAGVASVGAVTFDYEPIILITIIPLVFSMVIIAFAKVSPWDVTGCAMIVCNILAAIIAIVVLIIVNIFLMTALIFHLIFVMVGGFTYFFWMIYDTQAILTVQRGNMISSNYILAAIHLHVDLILIFFHLICRLKY